MKTNSQGKKDMNDGNSEITLSPGIAFSRIVCGNNCVFLSQTYQIGLVELVYSILPNIGAANSVIKYPASPICDLCRRLDRKLVADGWF